MNGEVTNSPLLELFSQIETFVFDVDGVLTDGNLILLNNSLIRKMHTRDGFALQLAVKKNYRIIIISGGNSEDVAKRLSNLGIEQVYLGIRNKAQKLIDISTEQEFNLNKVLYMGDDIPDYSVMKLVGLPTCPANACNEIKEISTFISKINGGEGCVREVIEIVLKLQNNWVIDDEIISG